MIIHCQTHCEYSRGLFPCFMFSFCKHLDTGKQIDKIKSKCFTITMDFQKLPLQSAIFFKTVCFILAEVFDKDDLHIAYKEQSFVARKDWEKREKTPSPWSWPPLSLSTISFCENLCAHQWVDYEGSRSASSLVGQLDHLLLLRRRSHLKISCQGFLFVSTLSAHLRSNTKRDCFE